MCGIAVIVSKDCVCRGLRQLHEREEPIWNEDGSIALVCNGEIYNHQALRGALEGQGHQFKTQSDIEVIVHLYEEYQQECLQYLEGIFAFALWDVRSGSFFAARDRCGVKPLYYAETEHQWIFGSEFQSILGQAGVDTAIDHQGLGAYHAFRFCPANETLVKGVKKLGAGEYAWIVDDQFSRHTWWNPRAEGKNANAWIPTESKTRRLHKCLVDAVYGQAATEVPSGILLSGGLDSTALLAIHYHVRQEVPDTFTVGFQAPRQFAYPEEYTELTFAREVASTYGSNHHSECYGAKDVLDHLPDIVTALDEPIADPTAIPLWYAVKMAADAGVKVVYSGEGLDELFNGYDVYREARVLNAVSLIPRSVRQAALALWSRTGWKGQGLLKRSLHPVSDWYQGVGGLFTADDDAFGTLLNNAWKASDPMDYVRHILDGVQDESPLTQMTFFDLRAWLPENTLAKSDKISMAHSVELRVPYLNQDVVDFALGLSDTDKVRSGVGKWMVREALRDLVKPEVLHRPKVGFPVPLTAWIFGEWKDYVMSTLLDTNAYTYGMYNRTYVASLFHAEENEKKRAARLLWAMLSLELWFKNVYARHANEKRKPTPRAAVHG